MRKRINILYINIHIIRITYIQRIPHSTRRAEIGVKFYVDRSLDDVNVVRDRSDLAN